MFPDPQPIEITSYCREVPVLGQASAPGRSPDLLGPLVFSGPPKGSQVRVTWSYVSPWKSSSWLPLSELIVLPLQFQNIKQNHLGTGLEQGGWSGEAGAGSRYQNILPVHHPKATAGQCLPPPELITEFLMIKIIT